ncbi:Membrane protease YdiL, CAAX protease family [Ruminococcaceae bacterium YRB3002]|nr:Membrane protease YdiL, CAAX protease family [Ruminococcaceae bacterium YRB3002]
MENTAPNSKQNTNIYKKKIRSKIYNRYNWSSLVVLLQIGATTLLVSALEIAAIILIAAKMSMDSGAPITLVAIMSEVNKYALAMAGVSYVIVNITAALLGMKLSKTGRIRNFIKKPQMSPMWVVVAVVACLGVSSLDSLIMRVLSFFFESSHDALDLILGSGIYSENIIIKIISISYIALLGPITEELLMRGTVLPMSSHVSPTFGMFVSALMFGLMHGNVTQLFNAFLLGLLMAYITLKSRSLIPAVIAHVLNNSSAVIVEYATDGLDPERITTINNIVDGSIAVLGIIALVFLLRKFRMIDEVKDMPVINKPVTDEELAMVSDSNSRVSVTIKPFLGSWALWMVVAYCAFSSVYMILIGNTLG